MCVCVCVLPGSGGNSPSLFLFGDVPARSYCTQTGEGFDEDKLVPVR